MGTAELTDIKEASGSMLPEDRVARTMDLQEDIAAKLDILKTCVATEQDLLPQGDKVPADAQVFKDELNRIIKYVEELQANTKIECDKYSNDVKYWAEYRTGIKEFTPWLASAEKSTSEGLSKPSDLSEVQALNDKVLAFDKTCENYLKVLKAAEGASLKMTTHTEADTEVAALKGRFDKVKALLRPGSRSVKSWSRNGFSLTILSLSSTPGWPRTSLLRVRTSSPWRRWSPLLENSRTSSSRRRNWLRIYKFRLCYVNI